MYKHTKTTVLTTLTAILLCITDAQLQAADLPAETPVDPTRVLFVTGVDYPGHLWRETTAPMKKLLESEKTIDARVVEDHEFLASDVIFDYDVILLHMKNYDETRRAEKVRANLEKFVADGGGLVLVHFTCGAFEQWDGFKELAGRVWDKTKRGHDPRQPFAVNVADKEHPITRDMADFEITDELYTCLGDAGPEIHPVMTAKSTVDQKVYPIAFVLSYGKGRVFHTLLGHDTVAVGAPGFGQLLRNGCLWTAGRLK